MIGAVDLGGTKVAVGVADGSGRLVAQGRFATRPERGPEAVIAEIVASLRALGQPLDRVGLASVGPLDLATGTIMSPPNFPGWDAVPIRARLEAALGCEVVVDNDANAAALAEYRFGAGQGARCLVYVTVSTGIGGGLVLDGRLLHGLGGGAGELGHQTIDAAGPLCGCGNRGCLEAIASGPAIAQAAREGLASGEAGAILALAGSPEALHAGHVAEAAASGDPFAAKLWAGAIEALAIGLGNVVTILAPDRLVIGGGVAAAGPLLLDPLVARMRQRVRLVPIDRLEVRLAASGGEAGLLGAVAIAL